ncbi:helix-turn-helix domain-containing protein [Curtobacterium sp. MCBD17_032]|uniref:MerR family transcriptional regulator n=1 Tax=Curtobacterium sp. MCBD17_032 TaxID=2175659 RepID=UPI000DA7EB54|nr:helix-turn-helix domain-containing protein [Curtobacterium sp. MCBD17_032]PZE84169.1 hypothetical protein DEI91_09755 [Curtobacterium sp. MCBD17_032]
MTDSNSQSEGQVLPIGDVAARLGVSIATVRRWERDGKLVAFRTPGNQRRFHEAAVDAIRSGGRS